MTVLSEAGRAVDPRERVADLIAIYSSPKASAADLLCDRHPPEAICYSVVEADLGQKVLTYGELRESSERFAAALAGLGVGPGDRVASLLGKSVEHLIAIMGIWRLGAVHVPLFTAFAPPAINYRLDGSAAKVVICDPSQRGKLQSGASTPESPPWRVVVTGEPTESGDLGFTEITADQEPGFPAAVLGGDAPLVHIYTSGTTGRPKGVVASTRMLACTHTYMEFGLNVRPDDVFWNAGDPGWAYGLYVGVHGSWCLGVPSVWLNAGFTPELTWNVLSRLRVTNFTAAPTVYRSLRTSNATVPSDLVLRRASSAGEPLTPEVNDWARRVLGVPVHDQYGQTEVGMLINNHHHPAVARPLKSGSMGVAMPGWTGAVLQRDRDETAPPGTVGRIAFDLQASPLASFTGYVGEPERSAEKITGDGRWYLSGDTGVIDEDGYFYFRSRDDDVIITAGYRIGPEEVEAVLLSHPSVVEAAVIAAPDQLRGEVVEAYVVLHESTSPSMSLAEELQALVKADFAKHAYPRVVHLVDALPRTPSGKIQRYVLRERRREKILDSSA